MRLGRAYLELGFVAAAQNEIERAAQLGLENEEIGLLRVQALLLQRDFQKALDVSESAASRGTDAALLELRGMAQLGTEQADDAWTTFSTLLDHDPDSPAAKRGLARVALAEGELHEAEAYVDAALATSEEDVQTWTLKAELELVMERFDQAEGSFRRLLELSNDELVARSGLARALIAQGKLGEAHSHVSSLLESRPNTPVVQYLSGLLARLDRDWDGARRALRAALELDPDHVQSLLVLADTQLETGAFSQAEELLTRCLAVAPDFFPAQKLLGAARLALGRPQEALDLLQPLEARAPSDPQLLHLLGTALSQRGELQAANRYLSRAAELTPDPFRLRSKVALNHLISGDPDAALAELDSAETDNVPAAESLRILAYLEKGDVAGAMQAAERLASAYPDAPSVHNALGVVSERAGDLIRAQTHYRKARALDGKYVTAALNLARLNRAAGRISEARTDYEAVLKRHPDHPMALVGLAAIAEQAGRRDDALSMLERARQMNPEAITPRIALSGQRIRDRAFAEALELANEARWIAPGNPRVLMAAGRAELAAGEVDAAITTFRALTQHLPRSADAHLRLALAYEQKGDRKSVRASLERALELEPAHFLARVALGNLALHTGRLDEAEAIATELVAGSSDHSAALLLAADVSMAAGRTADAVAAYRQAFDVADDPVTLFRLHTALERAGHAGEALQILETWVSDHPDDVGGRLMYASSLERHGSRDLALLEYERALYYEPDNAFALNNLALLYHRNQDPRAVALAAQAYQRHSDIAGIADTYGWLLVMAGEPEKGLPALDDALRMVPDNASVRYHHAAALAMTGQATRAREGLQSLLRSDLRFPERESARALLEELR